MSLPPKTLRNVVENQVLELGERKTARGAKTHPGGNDNLTGREGSWRLEAASFTSPRLQPLLVADLFQRPNVQVRRDRDSEHKGSVPFNGGGLKARVQRHRCEDEQCTNAQRAACRPPRLPTPGSSSSPRRCFLAPWAVFRPPRPRTWFSTTFLKVLGENDIRETRRCSRGRRRTLSCAPP